MSELSLAFGYTKALKHNARAAWGARAIWNPGRMVDIVPDRQDAVAVDDHTRDVFLSHLNENFMRQRMNDMVEQKVLTGGDEEHILYFNFMRQDGVEGTVSVTVNPMNSSGYLYMLAQLV